MKPVTVRLPNEDIAYLDRIAAKHALPGEKRNLSRAVRAVVKKARKQ